MISVFYACLIIGICTLIGGALLKVIYYKDKSFMLSHYTLLLPLLGAASLMLLSQFTSVVLTMNQLSIFIPILLLLSLFILRKHLASGFQRLLKEYKGVCILGFLMMVVMLYPVIYNKELASYMFYNNDGIFYLSTMDWLQDNTIFSHFDLATDPFHEMAQIILNTTRFGMDTLGALFCAFLDKASYQLLTTFSVSLAVMSSAGMAHFFKASLKLSKKVQTIGFGILGFSFGWVDLLIKQYSPQILGIGCLFVFCFLLINVCQQTNWPNILMAAIFLNATVSAYAEFASYVAAIFVLFLVLFFFYQKKADKKLLYAKGPILAGVFSFVVNPVGFLVAIRFYLSFLNKTEGGNYTNFDAYNGDTPSFPQWITRLFGVGSIEYKGSGKDINWLWWSIAIGLCILALVSLAGFVYALIQTRSQVAICLLFVLGFFGALSLYFQVFKFAYAGYKTISSFFVLFLIICIYGLAYAIEHLSKKVLLNYVVGGVISVGFIGLSLLSSLKAFANPLYFYGDSIEQLHLAAQFISPTEPIGISSDNYSVTHRLIYALQDHAMVLVNDQKSSYYNWPTAQVPPRYMAYDKHEFNEETVEGTIIWSDQTFILVDTQR